MTLVDMDGDGRVSVETLPFSPVRRARLLRGTHAELLLCEPSNDFIKAVLTDDVPVIDGMKRLREVFPNACELAYARHERPLETKSADGHLAAAADPLEVVGRFLAEVGLEELSDAEQDVVAASLTRLRRDEDAA